MPLRVHVMRGIARDLGGEKLDFAVRHPEAYHVCVSSLALFSCTALAATNIEYTWNGFYGYIMHTTQSKFGFFGTKPKSIQKYACKEFDSCIDNILVCHRIDINKRRI